ncbi:MAG: protein kinase [Chlamydiales bacterium]|nr:protein kinase [Chlamydiales bacterium]
MQPIDSICDTMSALSLDTVDLILQKTYADRCILARSLAEQVLCLHQKGLVHRELHIDQIVYEKGVCFFNDRNVVSEVEVRKEAGIMGYSIATVPPERTTPPFMGDWYKGDIFALGVIFCQLAGCKCTEDEFVIARADFDLEGDAARDVLTKDPLPQSNYLAKLGVWMMHSNPEVRPKDMQQVCDILKKYADISLPLLPSYTKQEIKNLKVDPRIEGLVHKALRRDKELSVLANTVAKLFSHARSGCLSRKLTNSRFSIIFSREQNFALFLPKEKTAGGTFKNSRVPKLLTLNERGPTLSECHALSTLKRDGMRRSDYYEGYSREMEISKRLEGRDVFPLHIASFGFIGKSHKRLGIYEHISYTLGSWIDEKKTLQDTINTISSMFQTVQLLHDAGLVHRDLKPSNMLVCKKGKVLLCDPDSVCVDEVWKNYNIGICTHHYRAPERKERGKYVGSWMSNDVYSLGCIVFELAFNGAPSWFIEDKEESEQLKKSSVKILQNSKKLTVFQSLALQMVEPVVERRLTLPESTKRLEQIKGIPKPKQACVLQ